MSRVFFVWKGLCTELKINKWFVGFSMLMSTIFKAYCLKVMLYKLYIAQDFRFYRFLLFFALSLDKHTLGPWPRHSVMWIWCLSKVTHTTICKIRMILGLGQCSREFHGKIHFEFCRGRLNFRVSLFTPHHVTELLICTIELHRFKINQIFFW